MLCYNLDFFILIKLCHFKKYDKDLKKNNYKLIFLYIYKYLFYASPIN